MKLIDDRRLIDGFCVTASPAVAQNNERSKHQFGWSRLHLGKKAVDGSPQHLLTLFQSPLPLSEKCFDFCLESLFPNSGLNCSR
jgi:hypothetical protein